MTDMAIAAVGLSQRYGRQWALQNCDLVVPTGSITGLVGPNGAGKSTLMRLCVGLSRPISGHVSILDVEVRPNGTAHLPLIGYLDQRRPMYRALRVIDALRLGQRFNPQWDDEYARCLVQELGLSGRDRIASLSEGQAAMVSLVICVAKRPAVLILDEPLANLDPLARKQVLEILLAAVADSGITVLMSSHVTSELEPVCDNVAILAEGRVQIAASVESLMSTHHWVSVNGSADPLPRAIEVVDARRAERQTLLLVRGDVSAMGDRVQSSEPSLEDVVLAYLTKGRDKCAHDSFGEVAS